MAHYNYMSSASHHLIKTMLLNTKTLFFLIEHSFMAFIISYKIAFEFSELLQNKLYDEL